MTNSQAEVDRLRGRVRELEAETKRLKVSLRRLRSRYAAPRYRAVDRLHAAVTGMPVLEPLARRALRALSGDGYGRRSVNSLRRGKSDGSPSPVPVARDRPSPLTGTPEDSPYFRHEGFFLDLVKETENFSRVTWLGHPIWQNVPDLWVIQEVISEVRPRLLIETGTNRGGSALFYAHLFDLLGEGEVLTVDVEKMHDLYHPRIEFLLGSSTSPAIVERARWAAERTGGPVMVILDSDHSRAHVGREMEAYGPLVTADSYMLVQDGVIDLLPIFAGGRPGPLPAIEEFLAAHPEFEVDERRDAQFLITHHPRGWLRRKADPPSSVSPGSETHSSSRPEISAELHPTAFSGRPPSPRLATASDDLKRFVLEMPLERTSIFEFVASAAQSLPSGARLADIGAGEAPYRELFEHVEYVTVDWENSIYPEARRSDIVATAEAIPVENGAFDAVLSTQVLEHLARPSLAIEEMRRVLRPGGRLFLTAPLTWELHEEPYDFYRYTEYGLRHLLTSAGFTEVHVEPRNDCFATLAQMLRGAAHLMGPHHDPLDEQRKRARKLLNAMSQEVERVPAELDSKRILPLGYIAEAIAP